MIGRPAMRGLCAILSPRRHRDQGIQQWLWRRRGAAIPKWATHLLPHCLIWLFCQVGLSPIVFSHALTTTAPPWVHGANSHTEERTGGRGSHLHGHSCLAKMERALINCGPVKSYFIIHLSNQRHGRRNGCVVLFRMLNKVMRSWRSRGIDYDPFDISARGRLGEQMFALRNKELPRGTIDRGRSILQIIEHSFPTPTLTAAYFENLELLLQSHKVRPTAGQIVVGLGTGRSGSTSLTAMLATVEASCSTHENPPLISWTPNPEELEFHVRRLKLLSHYFSLVADVSHWWLNALDHVFAQLPGAKAVGLCRDLERCTESFMKMKGFGRGSYNHWAPYGNGIWAAAQWDPTYPTYPVPQNAGRDPDGAKYQLISRYAREYNERLRDFAAVRPKEVLLISTEDLSNAAAQETIFEFVGMRGRRTSAMLNVDTMADGRKAHYKF
jgi:hypothetical protein